MEYARHTNLTPGGRVGLTIAALLVTTVAILMAALRPTDPPIGVVGLLGTSMLLIAFSLERPRRRSS